MATEEKPEPRARRTSAASQPEDNSYVVPVVHSHLPARTVELGFWGGLIGAAALGAIDAPLALIVGAGVLIARHRH